MASRAVVPSRVFRSKSFTRAAARARIGDEALCAAILQVMQGQADDLGGGVYKKRLDKNRSRSIILARGGRYWVYEYLFAKQDRPNIDAVDLANFRKLARVYEGLSERQVELFIGDKSWEEICHGSEEQV